MIRTWQDIPGFFDFIDIYNLAVDDAQDGDMLVEVGTFLGKSAAYMADRIRASRKNLRLFTVDSWNHPAYTEWWKNVRYPSPTPEAPGELIGLSLPQAFARCMDATGTLVTAIHASSVHGSRSFQDHSLFFVFLDADHEYEGIRDDIAAWKEKIKPGGILAGHDYRVKEWPGVEKAVDAIFGSSVEHRHNSWLVRM